MTSTIEPCLLVGVKASSATLAARNIALPRAVAAFAMYGHGSHCGALASHVSTPSGMAVDPHTGEPQALDTGRRHSSTALYSNSDRETGLMASTANRELHRYACKYCQCSSACELFFELYNI